MTLYLVLTLWTFQIKYPKYAALKCICNEIFDVGIFALSKNFIFSDHFDTNLVEKFRLEVGKFLD